ncbi:antitoxin component YwqK of YwqJK toxin-antitoxin module [Flavobacterium sp. HSC-32F16]|uniref:toxin-antitoxin system YwqK family antitoxin n=1 Tax=Flavobacterium sp. HSC-32F16 TaxID=2910964 RepID=UPI0020A3C42F|nr:hypothetical protein [Flavobacterium sp. HSC-32F16]MCP2028175.1 antitoxin component YwqK of YwqJK toxin-antitoxin module [Flavobacterium sp. HSC-32F16]
MEPLYFDANWKTTTKENASFYRIQPSKKSGNLVLVEDFYINKTPQFQGYSFQDNEDNYVGDVLWLDKNGFDSSFYQFYNFSAVSNLVYYYPSGKKFKTVQYKNGRKDGETIVYHEDGTVLMKGKYEGGRPVNGDFEEVINWDNYRLNKSDNEADREEPIRMTEGMIIRDKNGSGKKREVIKKKIFWLNSKQLAQEIWYDITSSNTEPFKQINYDKSGKILQTINEKDFEKYGRDIANGIVYDYYSQNKFAIAVKSEINYKNGQKNGEATQYYPNGKVLKIVKYSEGEEQGDQIEYNPDGTIKAKRIYKNGQPFEGNFDEKFASDLSINQNYSKGLKEGEAIVKDESGSVVAKGVYKDEKPFNGTFVIKNQNDQNELINVSGYKKNGVQKIFNYYLDDPVKTYTVINDIKNGETVFYDNREITGRLEYKNDLPFEGKLVEAQKSTIYKKGAITEEIYYRSEYDKKDENNIVKTIYFENGKRTKIVNQSFLITSDRQDSYVGIYRNDTPFSGYFATESNEFNHVDYYENGIIKYQYSNNYLENLEKYQYPNYDIKSTYKDGKIVDGPEYIKLDRQFISKYWKNGVLTSYDLDLFAMHYFNRFHFELKDKGIEITISNSKKKAEIVIEKQGGKNSSKLIIGKKTLLSKSSLELENTILPNLAENILYYESNDEVLAKMIHFEKQDNSNSEEQHSQEFRIITNLFISNINDNETIEANFNTIAEEFSTKKSLEALLSREEAGILASLRFNKEKKPDTGILIVKSKSEMYDLKSFLEGKVLGEKKNVDFKNIRAEVENLTKILENKMNEKFK